MLMIFFNDNLTLRPLVTSVCKTAYCQIHFIRHIRKFLTFPAAQTIVHSLAASRLDYCNSALVGLIDIIIDKLESVQNPCRQTYCSRQKDGAHHASIHGAALPTNLV